MSFRVVHYINQFFAGIGGEEKADHKPEIREGVVGPGQALQASLGDDATVVATVICGDGYFAENIDKALEEILALVAPYKPDLFVAGPAFNAGRYGTASGATCAMVGEKLDIPTVTGMHPENPGVDMYRKNTYIVETADSARGLRKAMPVMAGLGLKLLKKEALGSPAEEGYLEKGVRHNVFFSRIGAERAAEMLAKKLRGEEFVTEYPMPSFDRVAPAAPLKDLKNATLALVTSGGICPKHNPDHIEASSASKYGAYSIADFDKLSCEDSETAHGGYDPTYANADPNRVLPVDVLRDMEKQGVFKKLYGTYFTTVGNGTPVANAKRFGAEIAQKLKADGVDAVILTST